MIALPGEGIALLDVTEKAPKKRGSSKKRAGQISN
jgi:hypothetical protein